MGLSIGDIRFNPKLDLALIVKVNVTELKT
jgi:hypothetical protein